MDSTMDSTMWSTYDETDVIDSQPAKSGIGALTIAMIVVGLLCALLLCHAVFMFRRYQERKSTRDEGHIVGAMDPDGNVDPDAEIFRPEEIEETPEPLEQLSAPDSKLLELSEKNSGFGSFVHKHQDTQSQQLIDFDNAPDQKEEPLPSSTRNLPSSTKNKEDEPSSTRNVEEATSTVFEKSGSSTELPTQHFTDL